MTTVNVEAFENLKRVIRAAPPDLFDMSVFACETECETAHCAAGWAAVDPWFQENTPILEGFTPAGGEGVDCDDALERTFGISNDEVYAIFYKTSATKDEVIATIDEIIAGAGESA